MCGVSHRIGWQRLQNGMRKMQINTLKLIRIFIPKHPHRCRATFWFRFDLLYYMDGRDWKGAHDTACEGSRHQTTSELVMWGLKYWAVTICYNITLHPFNLCVTTQGWLIVKARVLIGLQADSGTGPLMWGVQSTHNGLGCWSLGLSLFSLPKSV